MPALTQVTSWKPRSEIDVIGDCSVVLEDHQLVYKENAELWLDNLLSVMIAQWDSSLSVLPVARVQFLATA